LINNACYVMTEHDTSHRRVNTILRHISPNLYRIRSTVSAIGEVAPPSDSQVPYQLPLKSMEENNEENVTNSIRPKIHKG
jgi:hypothetical protein